MNEIIATETLTTTKTVELRTLAFLVSKGAAICTGTIISGHYVQNGGIIGAGAVITNENLIRRLPAISLS